MKEGEENASRDNKMKTKGENIRKEEGERVKDEKNEEESRA